MKFNKYYFSNIWLCGSSRRSWGNIETVCSANGQTYNHGHRYPLYNLLDSFRSQPKGKNQSIWAKTQWVTLIRKQIELKEETNGLESSKLPTHLFLLIFVLSPREDSISVELFTKLFFGCLQLSTWVLSTTDWWSSRHFSERNNTPLILFFWFTFVQFFLLLCFPSRIDDAL